MPGLIRGMARTAVVAGTATAVSGRVQRRQAEKFAERDQAIMANRSEGWQEGAQNAQAQQPQVQYVEVPAAAPAETSQDDKIKQLKELGELHANGILTDEEFAQQKAKILG